MTVGNTRTGMTRPQFENSKEWRTPKRELARPFEPALGHTEYSKKIAGMLEHKDFEAIEKFAGNARKIRSRIKGGDFKIDSVYVGASRIYESKKTTHITDKAWRTRIDRLTEWKNKYPDSVTARIALAEAYLWFGFFVRGHGPADTVSKAAYTEWRRKFYLAEAELSEISDKRNECPRWYGLRLFLAKTNSWSQNDFDKLYEEATSAYPSYFDYRLTKADYLKTKRGGGSQRQEWLDDLPAELVAQNDRDADISYFIIFVQEAHEENLTVDKTRFLKGFNDLDRKYGVDDVRLNQFALFATKIGEYESAKTAFARIGNRFIPGVWGSANRFYNMRAIAKGEKALIRRQHIEDKPNEKNDSASKTNRGLARK